jgi:predicted transcriptional regulator
VIDDENNLLGIIAEKDVLHNLFPSLEELMESLEIDYEKMMDKYVDVINLKVEDIMTKSAISIRPDLPCIKAASIMVKHKFRRIPVADDGKLVGMLSLGDVHKAIFQTTLFKGDKKLSFQVN